MKKSFFSCHATVSRYLLQTTVAFSLMICVPVNGMLGPEGKYLLRLLNKNKQPVQLSPVQACYVQRGREAFLQDLAKGTVKSHFVQDVARLFTRKQCVQRDDYMRGFLSNVNNMNAIRKASKNTPDYEPAIAQLTKETEDDSFEFAQISVGVDNQAVSKIVDEVPSILNRPTAYYHGYSSREGTLLNYVEDELHEESDFERRASLSWLRDDLLNRGAKRLDELNERKVN